MSSPTPADQLVIDGAELLREEKPDEAKQKFDEALKLDPQHAGAYAFRSEIASRNEKWTEAIEDLDRAIECYPAAPYFMGRGEAKVHLGKYHEAIQDFEDCIKNDRRGKYTAKACLMIGMSRVELGEFEQALPSLDKYVVLNGDDPMGFAVRSVVHAKLGQKELSESDAQRAESLGMKRGP